MIRSLLLAAALIPATEAAALTCAPVDPLQSFREAHAAPESYVVLHGELSFDPARMPDGSEMPPPGVPESLLDPVEARFEGMALGLAGFSRPVSAPVLLVPSCFGQFCGSIAPGEGWLLFARASGSGAFEVEVDPCGTWAFQGVPPETLEALADCFRSGTCPAP